MITSRRPVSAALVAVALAAVLTSCSDDAEPGLAPTGSGPDPSIAATPAPSPTPSTGGSPTPPEIPPPAPPLTASPAPTAAGPSAATLSAPPAFTREPVTREPSGGPLGVSAVRAAAQDGYDRVVIQLGGKVAGTPGWRVQYVERPTRDGSGEPIAVQGSSYLQVIVSGVGYPMDTGVTEPAARRIRPAGTQLVREVVLDGVFEGQFGAYIGLDRTAPYRVFRLTDPARVVVDVQHR